MVGKQAAEGKRSKGTQGRVCRSNEILSRGGSEVTKVECSRVQVRKKEEVAKRKLSEVT